jgi:predicted alpha/beta hydrolase family esterase
MLWRKVIASRSYCSEHKEAIIAAHIYGCVHILHILAITLLKVEVTLLTPGCCFKWKTEAKAITLIC